MKTVEEINNLKAYAMGGSDTWYSYPGLAGITSSLQDFCEAAESFWLLDLIASYQKRIRTRYPIDMQIWTLDVNIVSRTGKVRCACEDDAPPCVEQAIDWTNFPLPYQAIYVGSDGIAYLPEEC